MNRTFDFYEYAGIIVPGAILIVGLVWLFPQLHPFLSKDGLTFGEFGVFVIIAYATGQLVQGLGNLIEQVFWRACRGIPTTRMLKRGAYLDPRQHQRLLEQLHLSFNLAHADLLKQRTAMQLPVVRQMYAAVAEAKRNQRIDIFLGNYGLARGLAAAILVLLALEVATLRGVIPSAVLVILLLLALQRMFRFGRHYAAELATQFVTVAAQQDNLTARGEDRGPESP